MIDELTLHRYLDGRLDEQQRGIVDAALRSDPAARRTLDALREETRLIAEALEAQSEPLSGPGRIGARVVALLHLEERSRAASLRTRRMFRRALSGVALAAALALCFLLVKPRSPAGSFLSGTHATVSVRGETHDAQKGAHVYDGDAIAAEKGQFVRLGLAGAQWIDIDEFSNLSIEKSGPLPVIRLARGRIGVTVGETQNALQIELPDGTVTVQPGSRADVWLAEAADVPLPGIFYAAQTPAPSAAPLRQSSVAIVTVFKGYALIACESNGATFNARQGVRALFTKAEVLPRLVNMAGSRVLDLRGDDGLHVRDNAAPVEWTLMGMLDKPRFETLGRRWGLCAGAADSAPIEDALRMLDAAMAISPHATRAEKIADGQKALRQACETLAQNDERRRMALTLEGLAHFEQGCARFAAGGQKGSDPQASFDAARVAFEAALSGNTAGWRGPISAGGGAFLALPAEAQAALTASFSRAVALSWSAGIMPPKSMDLDCERSAADISEKHNAISAAAEAFAQLHDDLGHTVESLAALLGEALCDLRAGDAASRRRALDTLHLIVSKPLAGTDGAARQAFDGIRKAAAIELIRLNACGSEAQKTLDAAHDYELIFPLGASKNVRALLLKGLEAQKSAAFADKRYDNAAEACDALLTALDEADGHWLDAGQLDPPGGIRHAGVRLDRLEALAGAKDWVRASSEAHLLNGNLPEDLLPRFNALQKAIRAQSPNGR